jgi:hypothetical protein
MAENRLRYSFYSLNPEASPLASASLERVLEGLSFQPQSSIQAITNSNQQAANVSCVALSQAFQHMTSR